MNQKLRLLVLLVSSLSFSQVQIGQDINSEAAGDQLGRSVNLSSDGSIMAIGANRNDDNGGLSGHVRIYENQSGTWVQIGQDIDGEAADDQSGWSVSLSSDGSIVAIGAERNDGNGNDSGHVRIYENQSDTWVQIGQDIDGEAVGDESGGSVSLSSDGTVVAIGARGNDGNGTSSGHVRIYENQGGTWVQIGQDIDGEAESDLSGLGVSLSSTGSIIAIGAGGNDANGSNSGHVRIYENQSDTWTQIGQDIDGETALDQSGTSVSLSSDGSIVAIGARLNDGNGNSSGHVRIYEIQSDIWVQIGQDIDGEEAVSFSGSDVSLSSDGSIVAIGAPNNLNTSVSGHVRIYENQSDTWVQIGEDIDGEATGDLLGWSVSLSSDGSSVAISARGYSSFSGLARVYDLSALLSSNEFVVSQFKLYPNPTKNQFTIQLDSSVELEEISIHNLLGQVVLTSKEHIVNTSKLASGSYIVEVITNQGKATKKLIID
ncbi:MAG: T9SS type A sorting domain-containing protein [Psychroserpens sp.]|uniref:T9SS type A sorting domain-containing protein n=1 Tax=Psychroserpens sp. TaxID=2020870 RepID=UPI0030019957